MSKELLPQDEKRLIEAAKSGKKPAFAQLYRLHHRRVYALAYRMLSDQSKAEDICQEVFIKVWQQLAFFRGQSSFSTWLYSISTRTVVDHWRQNKDTLSDGDLAVEPATEELHDDRDLEQLLHRLPAKARAVFVLFAIEGYQHNEIAQLLEIAEGNSKAQYHRARQLLKEWLDEN